MVASSLLPAHGLTGVAPANKLSDGIRQLVERTFWDSTRPDPGQAGTVVWKADVNSMSALQRLASAKAIENGIRHDILPWCVYERIREKFLSWQGHCTTYCC